MRVKTSLPSTCPLNSASPWSKFAARKSRRQPVFLHIRHICVFRGVSDCNEWRVDKSRIRTNANELRMICNTTQAVGLHHFRSDN
jgi:hypothetical protein